MSRRPAAELSVHAAAEEAPDADAVVTRAGVLSYRAFAAKVAGAQSVLRAKGFAPGERWALVAHPDLASLVAVSAALEEGLVPCLLHPRLPAAERDRLAEGLGATTSLDAHAVGVAQPEDEPPPNPARDAEADFAVFFTSGSSGQPKGVRLSRRAFVAAAEGSAANLGWQTADRWLLNLPVAHVGGFSILTRTRLARRALVLDEEKRFDPGAFVGTLEDLDVTLASLVPTMLQRLLKIERPVPRSLRAVLLGGAPAPGELLDAARLAGWPVLSTYGLTEACSQVTVQPYGDVLERFGSGYAGEPLSNVEVRVDAAGGIWLRGPTLFSGYLPPRPDVLDADGWFDTGDRGWLDERGHLYVRGRASELIISGGENVSPARVEDALRTCDGVVDAVVYGLPDDEWGERVAASVVLNPPASIEALERVFREQLAGFERPRPIDVVAELPLLPSGKIDRRAVRERALQKHNPPRPDEPASTT